MNSSYYATLESVIDDLHYLEETFPGLLPEVLRVKVIRSWTDKEDEVIEYSAGWFPFQKNKKQPYVLVYTHDDEVYSFNKPAIEVTHLNGMIKARLYTTHGLPDRDPKLGPAVKLFDLKGKWKSDHYFIMGKEVSPP